mgnify:CR=1 FL=1
MKKVIKVIQLLILVFIVFMTFTNSPIYEARVHNNNPNRTIDEVAMAGGYFATDNKNYYLYTGTFYYTMTPNFFRSTGTAFVFIVNNTGKFPNSSIGSTAYIRPVINLNGNVKLSGTGTYDNVYEVVK